MKSELDLFAIPPTQTSIEGGQWVDTHPNASIAGKGPIEFVVSSEGEQYFDLSNVQLLVEAQLLKADGTNLEDAKWPGPVNNFLHSMFEEVEVSLGDNIITAATHTYPYRAYIENLVSLSSDAKASQMSSCLWFQDDSDFMDSTNAKARNADGPIAGNSGLQARGAYTHESKVVQMVGRLHSDMFSQDRLLINKVKLRVKLYRSRDAFCVMSEDAGVTVKILNAVLYVRRVDLSPSVFNAHQSVLAKGPAKYPIRRVVCKYFQVAQGSTSTNQENLFSGQMPIRVIVGCVDSDAFNGAYDKNPFNFKHNKITELGLYVSGYKEPIKALHPNFPDQSLMSYVNFLIGAGKWGKDEGCGFDRDDYNNGYTLFAWDLSADLASGADYFQLKKDTSIRLEATFGEPLARPINILVYAEFENMIMIDRERNVTTNFTF